MVAEAHLTLDHESKEKEETNVPQSLLGDATNDLGILTWAHLFMVLQLPKRH